MKKLMMMMAMMMMFVTTGCNDYQDSVIADPVNPTKQLKVRGSRYEPQYYVDIKPAEVAYMIKMTGNSEKKQNNIKSTSFKDKQKVQGKRVRIPFTKILSRETLMFNEWKWMPQYLIIKLDCSMKTMEWTYEKIGGSTTNDDAIRMESKESIEFYQNFVLSAKINQLKDYIYLDQFGVKPLSVVLNSNVKGDVASFLSSEASQQNLKDLRGNKAKMYDSLKVFLKAKYEPLGVDIVMVGAKGGFTYKDKEIQQAINKEFKSSLLESVALKEQAQKVAEVNTKRLEAEVFAKSRTSIVAQQELKMRMDLNSATCKMLENSKIEFNPTTFVQGGGDTDQASLVDAFFATKMTTKK